MHPCSRLAAEHREVLRAGIHDGAARGKRSSLVARRPHPGCLQGFARSGLNPVLDQQAAPARRIAYLRDPSIGKEYLALVPGDALGRCVWILDPGVTRVRAHRTSSPRSDTHASSGADHQLRTAAMRHLATLIVQIRLRMKSSELSGASVLRT